MSITNILISGVGGQGLVLATGVIAEAAFKEGYDIKTSDVIGLSQRGGMVWGSVRFGEKVYSASIPKGEADVLLAMEQLEGLRWCHMLSPKGKVILSEDIVFPNRVLLEKEEYPEDISKIIKEKGLEVIYVQAKERAKALGNIKVSNIYLLGTLSNYLPFSVETWIEVIKGFVPPKTLDLNIKAFSEARAEYAKV
ncbi:indolepyruvate oxidoreductase subunit beta [Clostridium polynesiense]|uniref:indolepyruvate oxidoreductase subunit beta n=1 Tax=Clostridium polynesiense TaxID=1325933 RepID=UPI00058F37D9|nr:indolepyruvate oxidoreductase subunit beta [Clostridium polynesiense]